MRYPYRTLFWTSLAMTVLTWGVHVARIQAQAYTGWLVPTFMTVLGLISLGTTALVWGHGRLVAND